MITINQLDAFIWIVRLGSVSAAAIRLNLTQPAVSARLSNLEETLQVELFHRKRPGLHLTKEGALLLEHAEKIETQLRCLRAEITPQEKRTRLLRLGAVETIAEKWLAAFIARLQAEYPALRLDLRIDLSRDLESQLQDREIDLALMMGPLVDPEVENVPLPSVSTSWFCARDWDPARTPFAPIITFNSASRPFHDVRKHLLAQNDPRPIFPTASLSAGFEMIACGVGVEILPKLLTSEVLEARNLMEFDGGPLPPGPRFTASYLASPADPEMEAIVALAVEVARERCGRT